MLYFKITADFSQFGTASAIIEAADHAEAMQKAREMGLADFTEAEPSDGTIGDLVEAEACDAPAVAENTGDYPILTKAEMAEAIERFSKDCDEAQYTDTDAAWSLLNLLLANLRQLSALIPRIIIVMDGGLIQHALADTPDLDIGVIDYDHQGSWKEPVDIPQADTSTSKGLVWIESHSVDRQAVATLWPIIEKGCEERSDG